MRHDCLHRHLTTIRYRRASRRAYIAQAIASTKPDLLGLQEDCYFMTTELLDAFKLGETYSHYGRFSMNGEEVPNSNWPEDPFTQVPPTTRSQSPHLFAHMSQNHMRDGEFNSVWWNRERFQLKSNKTFWVSPAPSVAGSRCAVHCEYYQDSQSFRLLVWSSCLFYPLLCVLCWFIFSISIAVLAVLVKSQGGSSIVSG